MRIVSYIYYKIILIFISLRNLFEPRVPPEFTEELSNGINNLSLCTAKNLNGNKNLS